MKRFLLMIVSLLMITGSVMAQRPQVAQRPQFRHHGFMMHRAPMHRHVKKMTDEQLATHFAQHLRLDDEKTGVFVPIYTNYRIAMKAVADQYATSFRLFRVKGQKAERPTEEQIEKMKSDFKARYEAEMAVRKEFAESFLAVLSARQCVRLARLEREHWMYMMPDKKVKDEQKEEETIAVNSRSEISEGLASGIEGLNQSEKAGAWYSLDGAKLDAQPATSGVYIKDGKKVLVR